MKTAFFIGIAGGLGSMSRYFLGMWIARSLGSKSQLPLGTLSVNILGALLMGILVAYVSSKGEIDSRLRLVLGIGFLGGFTTYSSFALETVGFLERKSIAYASWYVGLTILCAGCACFLGMLIGRRL